MGGPSSLDVFAPIANPMLERIAALAARVGWEAADCAVLVFPLPMAPDLREHFDAETIDAIADMLDEFGQLTPADRQHFQQIATLALDRRLAHHAMQGMNAVQISRPLSLAVLLAACTLQRRAEVTGMRKDEVDTDGRLWTIPGTRTKNHRTHAVPLSDLALKLIGEAAGLSGESQFLFPSPRDKSRPIIASAMSHAWARLLPHLDFDGPEPDLRPHDLRRTGATNLTGERIGIVRFVVSRVLNHSSDTGGTAAVTAVYDRNAYLVEKRRALDAWAALLLQIVEGRGRAPNVVKLVR